MFKYKSINTDVCIDINVSIDKDASVINAASTMVDISVQQQEMETLVLSENDFSKHGIEFGICLDDDKSKCTLLFIQLMCNIYQYHIYQYHTYHIIVPSYCNTLFFI